MLGTGTLSLLAVQMLAALRPASLTVLGRRDHQFPLARRFGATRTVLIDQAEDLRGGADLVFEATGSASAVPLALDLARRGGSVVLEGIAGTGPVSLDPDVFALNQLRVFGVFGADSRAWQHAIALLSSGALDLPALVSHQVGLADYGQALSLLTERPANLGKVLLLP